MARAVQLPRPLPTREREDGPARDRELVPDSVLKALVKELEETVTERERPPARKPAPRPMPSPEPERVRYRYD
jgi:hypothetical protein